MASLVASLLLATACQPSTASPTSPAPAAQAGSVGTNPAVPAAWKRPLDVTPAAEQGKFKVISQAAAPGDKVRVFFLGAQF
jgi:hypothetical protein